MMSASGSLDHPQTTAPPELPLAEAVRKALAQTRHGGLLRVAVAVEGGVVVLRGCVTNYYLKQMAQTAVMAVPGVEELRNQLQVGAADTAHP